MLDDNIQEECAIGVHGAASTAFGGWFVLPLKMLTLLPGLFSFSR